MISTIKAMTELTGLMIATGFDKELMETIIEHEANITEIQAALPNETVRNIGRAIADYGMDSIRQCVLRGNPLPQSEEKPKWEER